MREKGSSSKLGSFKANRSINASINNGVARDKDMANRILRDVKTLEMHSEHPELKDFMQF